MLEKQIGLRAGVIGDFFVRCGIDTNVLVDLALFPQANEYFKQRGYSFPDKLLCTLPQCIGECKGVLINKYGFSEKKADTEIDKILKQFMIEKLPKVIIDEDIELIEGIGRKYELNQEDVAIIYGFWKLRVNILVVRDSAFEKTCKELSMHVVRWPSFS